MRSLLALLLAAACAALAAAVAGAQETELRVLTYNTHGLAAWIAGDDPVARFPQIGARANGYDVVLLQEDFEHHAVLAPTLRHSIVERGNPSRFLGSWACALACAGSGLTLLADVPRQRLLGLDNVPYHVCEGWVGGANDCLATKGFQHARIEVAPDLVVHWVNTHLDAGRSPEARAARVAQLAILRAHLERHAAGAALVLAGDLNLDAAVPEDAAARDAFTGALGLVDSGAAPAAGRPWQHLDYVFTRSGDGVAIRVVATGEDRAFVHDGAPLSDHPALFVVLAVAR